MQVNPHDFVWISSLDDLPKELLPEWVISQWNKQLPLVVRREATAQEKLSVGIRGIKPGQRFITQIDKSAITHIMNVESLVANSRELQRSMFIALPPVQVLLLLSQHNWPWAWAVTGSCAYTLVTDIQSMLADCDLDVLIRCPTRHKKEDFAEFAIKANTPLCRIDIHIETPKGGFSLAEWFKNEQVTLHTPRGAVITADPWDENL
ncbi:MULTISPECIES: malonate decarboxylase holo-ACP synthase [Providencia]|uniref:Malonate decarboxylase holo-ACP synthase n=1 Tax=Providencia stuartii TaxID=588 RepID=A0ABD5L8I6_PROST|nr:MULTISPECIES: malonate decarboxylase holo-ACP synthase [Providencia]ELR5045040.1 malonate decarboxylase holo-ACP synthase [Providencia rettgeri]ELR5290314.1 malonate decarboxylase holo-ACP synthase [Providencia stuartii]MCR4178704.1 malonate decarboxylase holo-ACP synthase [Providencia vermicola]URE79943.1 malonate decarboxylase holo-ACP synthase [Providencia stuartii]